MITTISEKVIRPLLALVVAGFFGTAQAIVVYDNGGPTAFSGSETTGWTQAEDFNIASGASITGATVYLAGLGDLSAWDNVLDYFVYSDASGTPGVILTSGAAQNKTVTDTGIPWCCGGNAFLVDFDFEAAFQAAASTTYWLGIHASSDFDIDDIYWVTTDFNGTSPGRECLGCTEGPFTMDPIGPLEHAFQLEGTMLTPPAEVPEPASVILLSFGLGALALRRRRKISPAVSKNA